MNLSRRLERLEERFKPSIKGWQNFVTYDGEIFYRTGINPKSNNTLLTPENIDYRKSFSPEGEAFSQEDIDKLANEGWQIIIVRYIAMAC